MINKVILIGRLGKHPEVKQVSEKSKVANFPIGTTEKYKDRDGQIVERTEWTNIVVWDQLAEIVEKYFQKGMLVYIEGKLRTESYEKSGTTIYTTKVIAETAQMLERKKEDQEAYHKREESAKASYPKQESIESDLPF